MAAELLAQCRHQAIGEAAVRARADPLLNLHAGRVGYNAEFSSGPMRRARVAGEPLKKLVDRVVVALFGMGLPGSAMGEEAAASKIAQLVAEMSLVKEIGTGLGGAAEA